MGATAMMSLEQAVVFLVTLTSIFSGLLCGIAHAARWNWTSSSMAGIYVLALIHASVINPWVGARFGFTEAWASTAGMSLLYSAEFIFFWIFSWLGSAIVQSQQESAKDGLKKA